MQKKILFIIPYFGKFNNYFSLWLHSCKYNTSIDWLIFTDDRTKYEYPENVKVIYTSFKDTVNFIQSKFDFKIVLNNPYQLCEFKIAYGDIYEEYLNGYDFWGFCDTDVIWGDLRKHITDEILSNYNKISWRGHLTLFKNNARINNLYKTKVNGTEYYKYVLSNASAFPVAPDEGMINYIFEEQGEKIYKGLMFADLKIRSYNFFLHHFSSENDYKNIAQIFLWDKGNLYRLYVHNEQVLSEDFAYIHFLKRPMAMDKHFTIGDKFLIVPNKFIEWNDDVDYKFIIKQSAPKFYYSYFLSKITWRYLIGKLKYIKSKKQFRKEVKFPIDKTYGTKIPAP